MEWFEYTAAGERPTIIVIQDIDEQPGYGAFWGEVMSNIHAGLGALGTVTNGCVRDLPDCAEGFQLLAGSGGALAQEAELDSGDTAWMLTATALVLMMTVPGVALFYCGMVRKKNVLSATMQVFTTCCLATLIWMTPR